MKATVMIPAYNAEKFLPRALESAFGQTYQGYYEVVVVNDGSTDLTPDIMEDFRRRNLGYMRCIHKENGGNASARNVLLQESTGEILFGLDADDILHPRALEVVLGAYDGLPEVNHIYTDQEEIDEEGRFLWDRRRSRVHMFSERLTYHSHFQGHLKSFRRSLIGDTLFDEELKSAVDWDFFLKLFPRAKILHIPQVLYSYRINSKGISVGRRDEVINNSVNLVTKHVSERGFYNGRDFKVVPVQVGEHIHYYDHLVDGESVMDPFARSVLEGYLKEGH